MPEVRASLIIQAKDEFSGPAGKAGKAGEDLNKTFAGTFKEMTGLDLASVSVVGAIGAVGAGIKASIDTTLHWAEEVDKLSRNLGISTEEASKMAIVAGDLGIQTGTLERAFKTMIKHGIQPSAESLKDIAAKYQALTDPVKRSQFAIKEFGRAGLEMTELLEKTPAQIDAMTRAAETSGRVMSREAVDAAQKYKIQLAQLNDQVKGLEVQIGSALIPVLSAAAQSFQTLITWDKQVKMALDEHSKALITVDSTYAKYSADLKDAAEKAGYEVDAEGNLIRVRRDGLRVVKEVVEAHYMLTEAERASAQAADETTKTQAAAREALLGTSKATREEADDLVWLAQQHDLAAEAAMREKDASAELAAGLSGPLQSASEHYQSTLENLVSKYDANHDGVITLKEGYVEFTEAANVASGALHKTTNEMLYQSAAAAGLKDPALTDLALSLGLIDANSYNAQKAMDALTDKFVTGKISATEYAAETKDLAGAINTLQDRKVSITVDTVQRLFIYQRTVEARTGYQHGGTFMIPPGYPNDTFHLGGGHYGSSGEKVTVTPTGGHDEIGNQMTALVATLSTLDRRIARGVRDGLQLSLA